MKTFYVFHISYDIVNSQPFLTYWGHIEASWRKYASVDGINSSLDNGLSPIRCQAIVWTNAGLL